VDQREPAVDAMTFGRGSSLEISNTASSATRQFRHKVAVWFAFGQIAWAPDLDPAI
jgi:hypothetical protein